MIPSNRIRRNTCSVFCIVILCLSVAGPVYAVSEAGALFLLISPSAQAMGMGQTYGGLATSDPMAAVFNPAYLGFYVSRHRAGFATSGGGWLPEFVDDLDYNCRSFVYRYPLKSESVSLGLGYHRVFLDLGDLVYTGDSPEPLGSFQSWDKAHAITLSALWNSFIRATFGVNGKYIQSHMMQVDASVYAVDFGLAVEAPVFRMLCESHRGPVAAGSRLFPYLAPGFSYSVENIGGELKYVSASQADPLPRIAYAGIHLRAGFEVRSESMNYRFLSFDWAREATDMLLTRTTDPETGDTDIDYQWGLDDIDPLKHLLLGKGDEEVITKHGYQFGWMDVFFLRRGKYLDQEGKVRYSTSGWAFNLSQAIRLLLPAPDASAETDPYDRILWNLDVEFQHSEIHARRGHPADETRFTGVTIRLHAN